MEETLQLFLKINKLKEMNRTGWILRGVKNSETIAQHIFRLALFNWFLAEKTIPKFNLEKIIKISLAHDLCEVYAGDMTPRWGLLPKDHEKRREFLKKRLRLTKKFKEERWAIKFQKEKEACEKLVENLKPELEQEITNSWLDYEKHLSPEGRFVKQVDKIETLLQAIEYFGLKKDSFAIAWWEGCEDYVDNPVLLDFLREIEKNFYTKNKANPTLFFLIELGKLKKLPRWGWFIRGIKKPETIANHNFTVALMVWFLGHKGKINLTQALKMALIHEICENHSGNNRIALPPLIFTHNLKTKIFIRSYQKKIKNLQTLMEKLPQDLKQEISAILQEYAEQKTDTAKFVAQASCLATLLQACQYWQEDKNFPVKIFSEQAKRSVSSPELIKFLQAIQTKFAITD